jgi:hypothetical protein
VSSWARAFLMRSSRVAPVTGAGLPGVSFTAVGPFERRDSPQRHEGHTEGHQEDNLKCSPVPFVALCVTFVPLW